MPHFHSDRTLAYHRKSGAQANDCSVLLEELITVAGPAGTRVETWAPLALFTGRAAPATNAETLRFGAGMEQTDKLWRVTVPGNVPALETHRITVTIPARLDVPASQIKGTVRGVSGRGSNRTETALFVAEGT